MFAFLVRAASWFEARTESIRVYTKLESQGAISKGAACKMYSSKVIVLSGRCLVRSKNASNDVLPQQSEEMASSEFKVTA